MRRGVSGDLLVVVDRGILIRRAEPGHSGVYHCQLEEHGFHWTAVTVRLSVWSTAPRTATSWSLTNPSTGSPPGSAQPWYQDVMAMIHPSSMEQHCLSLGYRRPRHRHPNREHSQEADPQKGEDEESDDGGSAKGPFLDSEIGRAHV